VAEEEQGKKEVEVLHGARRLGGEAQAPTEGESKEHSEGGPQKVSWNRGGRGKKKKKKKHPNKGGEGG